MLKRFKEFIIEKNLFQYGEKILVAVSGGVDSVVLCKLLFESGYSFGIAHCNFKLRGTESEQDESFVLELSKQYQVSFYVTDFDTQEYAAQEGISIQMAARDLRYAWFEKVRSENQYKCIATAHHGNDITETVLLNFTRGTGIAGFHGISSKWGNLIRPMLFSTKEEIRQYAEIENLKYREDSSNASTKYYRNLIRNKVIPLLEEINPGLQSTVKITAEKIQGVENFFLSKIDEVREKVFQTKGPDMYVDLEELIPISSEPIVLYELLKAYHFTWAQIKDILRNRDGIPGKIFSSHTHQLVKDRKQLIISPIQKQEDQSLYIHEQESVLETSFFQIKTSVIEKLPDMLAKDESVAYLDFDKLSFPLLIREWKEGDIFQPLGMKGKKKISDFFIDRKVPLNVKRTVPILLSGDEVAWVVNYRIDDRYKYTNDTARIFKIQYYPKY